MQYKVFNDEVYYTDEDIIKVSQADIALLKEKAMQNPRERVRLCSHRDVDDVVHEMLIVHTKGTYVPPHKHINKSESFHVIEGEADIIILHDDGTIKEIVSMGEVGSGHPFYYRLSDAYYHTMIIKTDFFVFHETTKGPFNRKETAFAPFAPDDKDETAVMHYMRTLEEMMEVRS